MTGQAQNGSVFSNPKTMGLPLWRGRVTTSFFCTSRVNSCADFVRAPLVCTARTQMCTHVKYPLSICRKSESGPHSQWHGNTKKTARRGKKQRKKNNLGSAVLWLLAFPRESIPNFPCIGSGNLSNLIYFTPCYHFRRADSTRQHWGQFDIRYAMPWNTHLCKTFKFYTILKVKQLLYFVIKWQILHNVQKHRKIQSETLSWHS